MGTKRKLDEDEVPTPVKEPASPTPASPPEATSFASFGLDPRLLQAITQEDFATPTRVQAKAIPHILEGKDLLARATTGSGKTATYLIPILEAILRRNNGKRSTTETLGLILVPTKELAEQVKKVIAALSSYCTNDVRVLNLSQTPLDAAQRSKLAESPEIIVSTPAQVSLALDSSALTLANLAHLVIDEADLVLAYGDEADPHRDLRSIHQALPKGVQTILTSATLTAEVETVKGLFCPDPVVLELDDSRKDKSNLTQFSVESGEEDKFLLAYVIFKLKLITGKCIIFVGNTDRCYRLKLYFEQFGIRSCVLNAELPVNSRIHIVEEFNKNVYDIIIAADDHEVLGERPSKRSSKSRRDKDITPGHDGGKKNGEALPDDTAVEQNDDTDAPPAKAKLKPSKRSKKAKEYGISRGIDFQHVSCVLNFDLPTSSTSYTHRVGRTARANQPGTALSFVVPSALFGKHKPTSFPPCAHDEEVLSAINTQQKKHGIELKPYPFDWKKVEGFRYRMNDALRAVTSTAVRDARAREIRQELLKSEKLKRHFEENPEDLRQLRHDGEVGKVRVQGHLKHVPDYLMPSNGAKGIVKNDIGFVGLRKETDNRIRKKRAEKAKRGKGGKGPIRRADPLKTFNARGRGK